MVDRLPRASHNLAEWAAELTQRLADENRRLATEDPDTFRPDLAMSLNTLSVRLGAAWSQTRQLDVRRPAVRNPAHRHADALSTTSRITRRRIDNLLSIGDSPSG
jgi:hypothetical protein